MVADAADLDKRNREAPAQRVAHQPSPRRAARDSTKMPAILRAEGGRTACACWTAALAWPFSHDLDLSLYLQPVAAGLCTERRLLCLNGL
jgi:hypothetical protein